MSIIVQLIKDYLTEDTFTIVVLLILGIITNVLQTIGFTRITANILGNLQSRHFPKAYEMFRSFIYLSIISVIVSFIYRIFQNKILSKLFQWTRFQLIRMMLISNDEEFSNENFSTIISPVNRVSGTTFTIVNDMLTYYIPNFIFLCVTIAYILMQHGSIGAAFLVGNLCWIIYLYLNWGALKSKNKEYETQINHTENYLVEILNNVDKIISRGQTPTELEIFNEKKDKSSETAFAFYGFMDEKMFVVNTIVLMTVVACIGLGIRQYIKGQYDHAAFVTFFTILLMFRDRVLNSVSILPEFIDTIGRSEALLTRFSNVSNKYEEQKNKKYADYDLQFKDLVLENVCFEINNKSIFENMNLQLQTTNNTIIGLTGPSGKGKSTMCKMFLKMYKCKQGSIYIDGVNIEELDPIYVRSNITYINQNAKLFDRKILENMLYGCSDEGVCRDKYATIMTYPKMKELFKGLDINQHDCGPLGEKLSGGQRQMVNIISGLINPCRILILDEPTNALDKALKTELLEIIKRFKNDKQSIIIITHDKDVYPLFDKHIEI